ncbi:hypothetical protein MKX03_028168, partial [Papaver bracteatum]
MNSSSFSSITDRYEGRLIMRMDEAALRIHDRLSECVKEEEATTDHKIEQQQHRIDLEEEEEVVPYVIVVQGPPNVGKSLLIKSLVEFFTTKCPDDIRGPITLETFEFFNLLQVHGSPNVIGVLSHLDETNEDRLTQTKQRFIRQFRNEIYDKAELFYLSGLDNG